MENMGDWGQKSLIAELTVGRETARQLQIHLNVPSCSRETREMLVQKILASYEKALSIVNFSGHLDEPHPTTGAAILMSVSLPSQSESPRSEEDSADRDSRRRQSMPTWTQQVRVSPGMGQEGPLDDGFSWRKYGQKGILGARYPRGYYRCTHRNIQGCLATKQVQRSDSDSTIFEITYRGRHTCNQANSHMLPPNSQPLENIQEQPINNSTLDQCPQQQTSAQRGDTNYQQQQPQHQQQQQLLSNFCTGLKVITQQLDSHEQSFPSFHFAAATSSAVPGSDAALFSSSMTDNRFMGAFSTSLISPSASGTNIYLSVPPSGMHDYSIGGNQSTFQNSELVSAATLTSTNPPLVDLTFPFGNMESDPDFTFDSRGFLV